MTSEFHRVCLTKEVPDRVSLSGNRNVKAARNEKADGYSCHPRAPPHLCGGGTTYASPPVGRDHDDASVSCHADRNASDASNARFIQREPEQVYVYYIAAVFLFAQRAECKY